jgi:hypothetical protein
MKRQDLAMFLASFLQARATLSSSSSAFKDFAAGKQQGTGVYLRE